VSADFRRTLAEVRRELRRRGGPGRVVFVPVAAELADELRRGVAVERLWLRDRDGELPELVVKEPGLPPAGLIGWSPATRRRRAQRAQRASGKP
jgi:hypothetical protein